MWWDHNGYHLTSKAQQQGKAKDIQVTSGWLTEVIVLYDFERQIFFVEI